MKGWMCMLKMINQEDYVFIQIVKQVFEQMEKQDKVKKHGGIKYLTFENPTTGNKFKLTRQGKEVKVDFVY